MALTWSSPGGPACLARELLGLDGENVVLTPHVAGATLDNFAFVAQRAVDNACRYLSGGALPPDDVVVGSPGRDR